jgi:hypothetical protein
MVDSTIRISGVADMGLILLIVVLLILFGGGFGYHGGYAWGGPSLGLGGLLLIILVIWLLSGGL